MSQTMSNEIQNIHYCTILSVGQWDFLWKAGFPLSDKVPLPPDERCRADKNRL